MAIAKKPRGRRELLRVCVEPGEAERAYDQWRATFRTRPGVKIRMYQRTVKAGGTTADVWVLVAHHPLQKES